jgi:hypothetical protein
MKLLIASPLIASSMTLALALACAGPLASGAHAAERLAAPPDFLSVDAGAAAGAMRWQAVDDDVLSRQTGKAPGASMVSGLVLDLMSQWQMPNGGSATAHGKLTVSKGPDNTLSAHMSTSAQAHDGVVHGHVGGNPSSSSTAASDGTGASPLARATGGQHVSVNGVSQVTQVAGDRNVSTNSAVIDFNGASPSTISAGSATSANGTNNASASATSASGNVKAAVTFGNGGVAVSLQTPAGIATQTIAPTATQASGSIAQLIQVAGNAQAVVNQLKLSVQTQAMSGALLRQLGVLQAMQNSALGRH